MAQARESPYIWATWLSRMMAGDVACHWQFWFQAHYKLTETRPDDFNLAGWQVDHTRMVTELRQELTKAGQRPIAAHRFKIPTANGGAVIAGEMDCLVVQPHQFCVYDCKTGMQRQSDLVQVMLYMYALKQQPTFADKTPRGLVLYKDARIDVEIPASFASNLDYFSGILSAETAPAKNPGNDCAFCRVVERDCPERVA